MHGKLVNFAALALALTTAPVGAQQSVRVAHDGVPDTSAFAALNVSPGPNVYRSASGAPGPKYWQNKASYDLQATLDTTHKVLSGTMTVHYTNNSPDTLDFIWFQLEQNAFRSGSLNSLVFAQDGRFGARDFNGGYVIDRVEQVVGGKKVPVSLSDQGTVGRLTPVHSLSPGETATFEAVWHFPIPEHGADRMGREGTLYEIAQWYPRVCVYDDVRGWNTEPYLGQGEFYLEYGDYTLAVTLPAGYIVAATGTLDNPQDVLTPAEVERLARAAKSDTTVRIVTAEELKSGAARPKKEGTLTWRFHAKNVRDVAWVASPEYQWDAASWHGILAQAYYMPSAAGLWTEAAGMARMSIREYSERWFQYPYPQISAVQGAVRGMEYPMLAMEGTRSDKYDLYGVITHEIGHSWFPMIVGSNERVHPWMDEGFNTFIQSFSEAGRYPERGDQKQRTSFRNDMEEVFTTPIEIVPDRLGQQQLYFSAYYKPAAGLQILREYVLGPEVFDDAFRTYIKRWAFKHPTPADFYRSMENAAGRRLDWFWRGWFIEAAPFDQGIDSLVTSSTGGSDTTQVTVTYGNYARGILPLVVRFSFADGTTENVVYPAEVWSTNSRSYVRQYRFAKKLTRVEVDPDRRLADVDRTNNSWTAGPGR